MTQPKKLVMATNNAGKLREARAIAGDRLEILSLEDIGFHQDIPETADSLEGNALIKVRAVKDACGLDCFADDTGLMVDALGGAPGVYSARYAGEDCNPENNIDLLLKNLEGIERRDARFRTCVALTLDGKEFTFEGTAEGKIAKERSGSHGFGYDPVFISSETGKCFAEMTDEEKNAISHRGRAITAMMKWLGAICICILLSIPSLGATDFILHNTFGDEINNIFDTPEKTYYLVASQKLDKDFPENAEDFSFLFCRDKATGELRAYNPQNYLSRSLIRKASYNAVKNYLLLIYDDYTIDILHDNGKVFTIDGLKNFSSTTTKDVRGISFDPEHNRAYLATDFGYLSINDKNHEVATSGIYDEPTDRVICAAQRLIILRDGKIYWDNYDSNHFSLSDFKEAAWGNGGTVNDLIALSPTRCIISRSANGQNAYYLISFSEGTEEPQITEIGNLDNAVASENKNGILFPRYGTLIQIDRTTGDISSFPRREEDSNLMAGSWDLSEVHYGKPTEGFYSVRRSGEGNWSGAGEIERPNAPAVFKSNSLMFTPQHGMLVNTHGTDQNFISHFAPNPILLSGLKDGDWTMHGLPYLDASLTNILRNPCGMAQDPDNPDVFYFGSILNGLLRYNINDGSSVLHITRTDDNPSMPGHVGVADPYPVWVNSFMLLNPEFDKSGNLVVAHINPAHTNNYNGEIWIWTPENRKASTAPESFKPFFKLKVKDIHPNKGLLAIPLSGESSRNMIACFPTFRYGEPFAIYDHNGTIDNETDDRQVLMQSLFDNDGNVSYNYLYCAVEDPATGLVWVGTDNGVFTFNHKDVFSNPGKVSRIKVSRNDGTSLADYLLSGIKVNNISIDRNGYKWFSLNGGGLVCTSADGKSILQEINSENSNLPSDIVYATCYNPDNNSLMTATSSGLCEYPLSGQSADGGSSGIKAYPNPVRHDYYGRVTIEGLEDGCLVKIADSAGNIVRELGPASGGRVEWDVCGINLDRVPSGVYFVLASSGPGGGSYSEVSKILVINR